MQRYASKEGGGICWQSRAISPLQSCQKGVITVNYRWRRRKPWLPAISQAKCWNSDPRQRAWMNSESAERILLKPMYVWMEIQVNQTSQLRSPFHARRRPPRRPAQPCITRICVAGPRIPKALLPHRRLWIRLMISIRLPGPGRRCATRMCKPGFFRQPFIYRQRLPGYHDLQASCRQSPGVMTGHLFGKDSDAVSANRVSLTSLLPPGYSIGTSVNFQFPVSAKIKIRMPLFQQTRSSPAAPADG